MLDGFALAGVEGFEEEVSVGTVTQEMIHLFGLTWNVRRRQKC